ncbi:MAG TPA: glycosyltransferase, partial [Methylomirabilota bacterium]|nr:glycosyltransferase [Methylomirabilota bacterium]
PPDSGGGTERYVAAVAEAQAGRGHQVVVLTGSPRTTAIPVEETAGAVRIVRYHGVATRQQHWSEFADPVADEVVRQLLAGHHPDVVHVHHWMRLTSRLVALAAEAGVPAVVTLHDTWAVCPRTFRLKADLTYCDAPYQPDLCQTCAPRHAWQGDEEIAELLAERYAHITRELALARRIVVPSEAHRRFIANATGLPAERLLVLPHPTLTSLATGPGTAGPAESSRPLRIGCFGALAPHKGQDVLLQALPLLPTVPAWEVHLFGRDEIAPFAARLRDLAQGRPVRFHGAYQPEDLGAADLDLVVVPSLAPESFSFTLDEALQLGLPVVVSDRGALAERAGGAALVVPAQDPAALAAAIRRLLEDPALRERLRSAARAHRPESLERHLAELDALYTATVSQPAPPRPADDDAALSRLRYRQVLARDARLQELDEGQHARLAVLRLYTESRAWAFVTMLRELKRYRRFSLEQARVAWHLFRRCLHLPAPLDHQYQAWLAVHAPDARRLDRWGEAARLLPYRPLISVVTPVYNVAEPWLVRAIESVRAQVYDHWELCLVNDSASVPHVAPLLAAYAHRDARIRVVTHPERRGIAGASQTGLGMAAGEFVAFLDHDDELAPHALYAVAARLNREPETDLLYSDEDKVDETGFRFEPAFKPDWSPDLFRSLNYLTHLSVIRAEVVRKVGGFRAGFDGSQDYDLLLRVSEATDRIAHIPDVLYSWRTVAGSAAGSVSAKPYAYQAATRALEESLARRGIAGRVERLEPGRYAVRYRIPGTPLVSVIVPRRDREALDGRCLPSLARTAYGHYEVLMGGDDAGAPGSGAPTAARPVQVVGAPAGASLAARANLAATQARGEYLLFLDDRTEVSSPDWMAAMLEHAQRPEVGAVGAQLRYPDGRLHHAGLLLTDAPGAVLHRFRGLPAHDPGYLAIPRVIGNVSAVTAACLMVRRAVFESHGGFDEAFQGALADADFCLRLRERGLLIVYTPLAMLTYHASGTRPVPSPDDERRFRSRWGHRVERARDPYWNPNLSSESEVVGLAL